MDGQGLQAVRGEIEAIVTFQAALNRIALTIDEGAITEWTGPRPDDVDALAADDGTFSREELDELRKTAGQALATRFREVHTAVEAKPTLKAVLARALSAATGGVVNLEGPEPGGVLIALTRTGSIRPDWAQAAATLVRDELTKLPGPATTVPMRPPATTPVKPPPSPRKKPAPKTPKPAAVKGKAKPKAKAKKPAARKAATPKKSVAKKVAKKPAPKKKPASKKRS